MSDLERAALDERLGWFLETVPEALLVVTEDGHIALANERAARLFGYGERELVGLGIEALIPQRMRERHRADRHHFAREPRDRSMGAGLEIRGRRRDGSEFRADVELRPRRTEGGLLTIAAVRDLDRPEALPREPSQLAARALQARDLERVVRLARLAAEDVEQLLALILAHSQRAIAEPGTSDAARRAVEEIRETTALAVDLTRQLLGYVADGAAEGPARRR